jgi:hypothetical protein
VPRAECKPNAAANHSSSGTKQRNTWRHELPTVYLTKYKCVFGLFMCRTNPVPKYHLKLRVTTSSSVYLIWVLCHDCFSSFTMHNNRTAN